VDRLKAFQELALQLRREGHGLDDVLGRLRADGADVSESLKVIRSIEGVSLGQAKEIVDASTTWADRFSSNDEMRAVAIEAIQEDVPRSWWESWVPAVRPYAVLLRLFLDGAVSAPEFELLFLGAYKNDQTSWPSDVFDVLDSLFGDVDDYCADDAIRARVHGIDEHELRDRAGNAFARLKLLGG
jgi:hypothetical protein